MSILLSSMGKFPWGVNSLVCVSESTSLGSDTKDILLGVCGDNVGFALTNIRNVLFELLYTWWCIATSISTSSTSSETIATATTTTASPDGHPANITIQMLIEDIIVMYLVEGYQGPKINVKKLSVTHLVSLFWRQFMHLGGLSDHQGPVIFNQPCLLMHLGGLFNSQLHMTGGGYYNP